MAILTAVLTGRLPGQSSIVDTILDGMTGILGGVLLNDAWEIFAWPGYYRPTGITFKTSDQGGEVNVGYDDSFQALFGELINLVGVVGLKKQPLKDSFGAFGSGVAFGTSITKLAEIYSTHIQIVPHEVKPPLPDQLP